MSPHILHDSRIRSVPWRDLMPLGVSEIVIELARPLFWLALSLAAAGLRWYPLALPLSFIFFLAGLRVVHNAFHYALGLPRWANDAALWMMSVVMLCSLHAVKFNHLRHHRLNLGEDDEEGRSAAMPGWKALLYGPVFTVKLHVTALRRGSNRLRAKVVAELALISVWIWFVFGLSSIPVLRYQIFAMSAGQCMTAFFAVWTVHRHCDRTHDLARTLRSRLKNALTFDMFRHIEHHLFPAVPTCHLGEISERLDRAAPELTEKVVF